MADIYAAHKGIVIVAVSIVVLGAAYFFISGVGNTGGVEYVTVERGDLVYEVYVTGRIEPADEVDLAFEYGGRVANIVSQVGTEVRAGSLLANTQNASALADVGEARARAEAKHATLDEALRGSREEEIDVKRAELRSATLAQSEAQTSLVTELSEAYTVADSAVRHTVDQFFTSPESVSPKLDGIYVPNYTTKDVLQSQRASVGDVLDAWKLRLGTLASDSDLPTHVSDTLQNLASIQSFLNKIALVVNDPLASTGFTQSTIDAYRTGVATARSNIDASISSVNSAYNSWLSAQAARDVSESKLTLALAGSTAEEIAVARAGAAEADANVLRAESELAKTYIYAPFAGIITDTHVERGETVSAGTPAISLISSSGFEVKANVPEVDIAQVAVGDSATMTLDAYGQNEVFKATVTATDPAETVIEGVSTYEITLLLSDETDKIRSGMTADITILGEVLHDVLAVPGRSVYTIGEQEFVRVVDDRGNVLERAVTTGMRGSDGRVEIQEGITEGEHIVTYMPQ